MCHVFLPCAEKLAVYIIQMKPLWRRELLQPHKEPSVTYSTEINYFLKIIKANKFSQNFNYLNTIASTDFQ